MREVFNRNQEHLGASEALANLGDLSGNIKEEIVTSNPPSVDPQLSDPLEGEKSMDKADEIIQMAQISGQEQTIVKQVALRVAEQATLLPSKPHFHFSYYSRICLVGRLSIRTILLKIGLTGQFCFFGNSLTGQLENLARLTALVMLNKSV